MKKTLTTLILAAIAMGAQALQVIDLTTRVTNTASSTGSVISIPGLVTNAAFTTVKSNNVIIGDTLSAAFAKVNFNFSNLPAGGGSATNAVPIFNGGATNLTVTNAFKLTSTTPYYSIASYTITNLPPDTSGGATSNLNGTYYPAPALGSGVLTNSDGYVMTIGTTGTKQAGTVQSISVTNGLGVGTYNMVGTTPLIFTNSTIYSGYSTNISYDSNATYVTVTGAGLSAANQIYQASGAAYTGLTDSTYSLNFNSSPLRWEIRKSATIYYQMTSYTPNPYGATWADFSFNAPAPNSNSGMPVTNAIYSNTNFFTLYSTNAWRFYSSTNVSFSSTVASVTGNLYEQFNFTNAPLIPFNNVSYVSSISNRAVWSIVSNNVIGTVSGGANFGSVSITNYNFTISSGSTNAPNTNTPPSVSGCNVYVIFKVGSVVKYLLDGTVRWDSAHKVNQDTGLKTSYLSIDASGNATLVIAGTLAETIPWTSSSWRTTIPSDACSTTPFTTPTKMY